MIHSWRIKIYSGADPTTLLGTLTPESPITRDGLSMTLDPHGDCREANWQGLNVDLGSGRFIQQQDIIEIQTQTAPGDPFVSRWSGFLITVPNRYSRRAQPFKALGLKQKLKKNHRDTSYPSDVASTVIFSILDWYTTGRDWGFTVTNTDFTGGLIVPEVAAQNYQPDFELIEQLANSGGVAWGVNGRREAFAHEPSTASMNVTEGAAGTSVTWEPVSGVDFVSSVRFVWKDTESGLLQDRVIEDSGLLAAYGPSERLVWLEDNAITIVLAAATYSTPSIGSASSMYDYNPATFCTYQYTSGSYVSMTATAGDPTKRLVVHLNTSATGYDGYVHGQIDLFIDGMFDRTLRAEYDSNVFSPVVENIEFTATYPAGTVFEVRVAESEGITGGVHSSIWEDLVIFEFRLEMDYESTLQTWASVFLRQTETPATATVQGLLDPEPTLTVTRPDSSSVDVPVEEVEYVISKQKNGVTNVKAGRRVDPETEITQALIKRRDQDAQNRAIRISKGVIL